MGEQGELHFHKVGLGANIIITSLSICSAQRDMWKRNHKRWKAGGREERAGRSKGRMGKGRREGEGEEGRGEGGGKGEGGKLTQLESVLNG